MHNNIMQLMLQIYDARDASTDASRNSWLNKPVAKDHHSSKYNNLS